MKSNTALDRQGLGIGRLPDKNKKCRPDKKRPENSGDPNGQPYHLWQMYVDGASRKGQCGVGILQISPEGIELPYAIHFCFDATNNEIEYEALHAVLKIAL